MKRRDFLTRSGLAIGASVALPSIPALSEGPDSPVPGSWEEIRSQFKLDPGKIHMAQMYLASHPKWVSDAIQKHRDAFDLNAVVYEQDTLFTGERAARQAAANYLQVDPEEVAMTDSTTMGLGILYSGLKLKPGDEILTTTHDHYATDKSLEYGVMKNGATLRRISLYQQPSAASIDEIIGILAKSISPKTRIVAVTWVHSSTGVKLPIREMAEIIKTENGKRNSTERIYLCVDGVHGFGVENITMEKLGCDFFVAGCHKWLFGPRGTGILYGKKDGWDMVIPTIPPFTEKPYYMWTGQVPVGKVSFSDLITPGGFHSFEHRYALKEAFEWHMQIGKDKIEARTRQLSTQLKDGLKTLKHIRLHTPVSPQLSSGINCFEVDGMKPEEVDKKLKQKNIIGSPTPYRTVYMRLTPSFINNEKEVNTCIEALAGIKS